MPLLTKDYIATAMGSVSFTDEQAARVQFFIDGVTGYIEEHLGTKLSAVVDETHRYKSDSYGCIEFRLFPVTGVTTVHDFKSNFDLVLNGNYFWDGLQVLSGLRSRRTYDVTFSYGIADPPTSIKNVAAKAVLRGLSSDPSNLKTRTVGDVTEVYGDALDFSTADMEVLENYTPTEGTIRMDPAIDSPLFGNDYGIVLNGPDPWGYYDY